MPAPPITVLRAQALSNRCITFTVAGRGVLLPYPLIATATVGDYEVEVLVEPRGDDPQFVATSVRVSATEGGPPVKTDTLRRLRLATIVDQVVTGAAMPFDGGVVDGNQLLRPPSAAVAAGIQYATHASRRRDLDDDRLAEVAKVYREAQAAGESTRKALVKHFDLGSIDTAAKWIVKARRRGFLPPAESTRPKVGAR